MHIKMVHQLDIWTAKMPSKKHSLQKFKNSNKYYSVTNTVTSKIQIEVVLTIGSIAQEK